ncbi:2-isopropylmalate synthase [Pseudomonas fluorescens]|uniref:2-isopropylmalate synthase n=1 Tax=Pseudomonas TaxID=286 RepID=UPI00025E8F16|nr:MULTISPECIES: 2-isopropylmalate synthase [Pseudomonas]AFJ54694.1 2-isopropylmalate synthase [Pseudomonas fluorescens A506]MBD8255260.1 2-isopropylmalate synthase [Pseudomonas fluorescens]NLT89593.1 2-isopropylmalate synthase [Pseudomonas lactis]KTC31732.1 2-isopropylmalate synthase [Pseudomonas sp. ICMP 19500]MBH3399411.1 2-isopropylmalate synthase [Pseudomonas fluorescens]
MMLKDPSRKYRHFTTANLPDRTWPSTVQVAAPTWCSVDMRDGNQALIEPMNAERKRRFFDLLVKVGFKQIEVGFPAASQTDFDYVRELIESGAIPDDVTIQVMTQARSHLIERTFEALKGAPRAIVHVYNATAPVFRDVVFNVDKAGCIEIATQATREIKQHMDANPDTQWTFQYSPETFCFTELDFALQVCEAVTDTFGPTPSNKMILNLPTTVEVSTANVFADQIEWFCRHFSRRDSVVISVHPHNDRGTGVSTAEQACLAGAERVEGTLFGNGERTGNVDILTLAMNLYTSGIDPQLDFSDILHVQREVEFCNQLPTHPRHPYAGELVFTAFSGSHQDAIKKGFAARQANPQGMWEVPYLPIDPADMGRSYEAVIRVNSQSGKGGVAYLLEQHGIVMPRRLQMEFSSLVQQEADGSGQEISGEMILACFTRHYLEQGKPYALRAPKLVSEGDVTYLEATLEQGTQRIDLSGEGNGPLAALVDAFAQRGIHFDIADYHEHATRDGAQAEALAYVEIRVGNQLLFGAARDGSSLLASLKAVTSAVNRASRLGLLSLVNAAVPS